MKRDYRRCRDINIVQTNCSEDQNPNPSPKKKKKIKFDFKKAKKNTLHSLYEVEHFLNNLKHFGKYVKLYNLLK